ncbi:hypothetical protein TanjilG_21893 [Lupinus angustifolius]|uniref:Uncharacterized protein n=1 Tax=Lupinus angustifolius TaxID=3871 RepID=A0A1J7FN74_LUPAN|nr:PREDICTED: uncharacterized protein LOC109341234 isoform X1 [Lupinus angustifolius]XP_019434634.1 PREDICTED: uncharacterized protein LOC109341234 isoform X1 [Lupinus angustifolius]OIV89435.1 hypothetical protein TanjilG_21893 [Lupinus angustifolius]
MNESESETVSTTTLDGSSVFHTIIDVLGFLLYMHHQIPSTVQDMSIEFDSLHSQYKNLEMEMGSEAKASFRRKHLSQMRDIKRGIKRMDKLMSAFSNIQTAIKLIPNVEEVIFALGATPLRPHHLYILQFSHGTSLPIVADDFARTKAADALSRKAIRTLISKGVGSVTYPGPMKLFVLVKAPSSFNQPLHFLPKRDFRCNRKVVPLRLLFKCRNQDQETAAPTSEDLIWFQCRHAIKGLAMNITPEE